MLKKEPDILNRKMHKNGFTILEVLLAVTIFTLVASALYTTFRVGVKAYEAGTKEINRMQHARVIFDTLSRDLRCVYYRPESSYNNTLRQVVSQYEREYQQAEVEGRLDEFLYGDDGENREGAENPYNRSIEIDLKFHAEDKEDLDTMRFVRYQYDDGTTRIQPWGLGRISYSVDDGNLIRTEEDIIVPMKNPDGEVIEEKVPGAEVLAKGVLRFDLKYGFFFNDDWMEAEDWDSSAKRYRNPADDLLVDDDGEPLMEEDDEYMSSDEYREKMRKEQMKPADGLPAFVRITVEIEELEFGRKRKSKSNKKKNPRTRVFSSLLRIPAAAENYMPSFFEDENGEVYWNED